MRRVATMLVVAALAAACTGVDDVTHTLSPSPTAPSGTPTVEPTGPTTPDGGAQIEITAPAPGDEVISPVQVAGTADVFEGTVYVRILGADGGELASGVATATCGSGCRGDWQIDLAFFVEERQDGSVEAFEVSAEDGTVQHLVRVPLVLVPGP